MHSFIKLLIALPLLASPVAAQDLFKPLQDMVDTLTNPPDQRPNTPRPKPPVAAAPEEPPVPRPRPPSLPDVPVVAAPIAPVAEEEPVEKPAEEATPVEDEAPTEEPVVATPPEPEPEPEPDRVYQTACPAVIQGLVEAETAPPLSEGICGETSPLVVTAVLSRGRMVPLSTPITTNCEMASALPEWVADVDGYAESMLESRLASVDTGTSYMCRNRVGGESGLTSEHGFADAVDVTGFTLDDGRSIGVEADWIKAAAPEGRLLRLAHDAACGSFMTVLGPEANAEHHDHLHLDMGCHGQSCQARICE